MDLSILGRDRITSAVQTLPVSRKKLLRKQMLQKLDKHRVQLISPRIVTCLSRCRCIAYTYPLYSMGLGLSRQAWIEADAYPGLFTTYDDDGGDVSVEDNVI